MRNAPHSLADQLGSPVQFLGENPQGQFMFANGGFLATHVFGTLPEGVTRFGRRIDVKAKEYLHSGQYAEGRATARDGAPYAPNRSYGRQAVLEYGHGYLAGLLDALPASVKSPVLTEAEHNAMMKRGRR